MIPETMKMQRYVGKTWKHVRDPLGSTYENIEIERCTFQGCSLGNLARRPSERTVVRGVRATDCSINGGSVGPVFFDEVHVTNLRTVGNPLRLQAPLLRHVVLDGKLGTLMFVHQRWGSINPDDALKEEEAAFAAAAETFYAVLDWALDISRAEFRELDWRLDMPARLVRRDPATQVVIKRERALEVAWQKLPLHPMIAIGLSNFVEFGLRETILAASKASESFKDELAGIELLRREGVAEPD